MAHWHCPKLANDWALAEPSIGKLNKFRQRGLALGKARVTTYHHPWHDLCQHLHCMAPCYCLDKTVDLMPTMNQLALQSMQNHGLHGSSSRTVDVRHNEDEHKLVLFSSIGRGKFKKGYQDRCAVCGMHASWYCQTCGGKTAICGTACQPQGKCLKRHIEDPLCRKPRQSRKKAAAPHGSDSE